jgi:HSP20 family protein
MALIRWEPSEGLMSLRRDMDQLFDSFFERTPWHDGAAEPAVEVSEAPDAVMVKAQVPGVKKEDLRIDISDNALTLKGEMKEEKKKEEKNYYRREIRYGAFTRTVPLPAAVQADKAAAQLKDGVLEVSIPKSERAKTKQIPIQA